MGEPLPVPAPTPVPPVPTPPALPDDAWYAWKPMWRVEGSGAASTIESLQDEAVLKKSYTSSTTLPDADRRFYPAGQVLKLTAEPVQASHDKYWLIHAPNLREMVSGDIR